MGIHYTTLGDLERDCITISREFQPRMAGEVREVAQDGNRAAKGNALRTSGTHGGPPNGHYVAAFSVERRTSLMWEWGPDANKEQGDMSFERGSHNQPAHHDIAKAADIHGADALALRVDRQLDRLFWPS